MKCPQDKAAVYTAVVVVCAIVLSICITAVTAAVAGVGMMTSGALASTRSSSGSGSVAAPT